MNMSIYDPTSEGYKQRLILVQTILKNTEGLALKSAINIISFKLNISRRTIKEYLNVLESVKYFELIEGKIKLNNQNI